MYWFYILPREGIVAHSILWWWWTFCVFIAWPPCSHYQLHDSRWHQAGWWLLCSRRPSGGLCEWAMGNCLWWFLGHIGFSGCLQAAWFLIIRYREQSIGGICMHMLDLCYNMTIYYTRFNSSCFCLLWPRHWPDRTWWCHVCWKWV